MNILKGQENISLRTKIRQQHKNENEEYRSNFAKTTDRVRTAVVKMVAADNVDKRDKKLIPSKDEQGLLRAHGR